MLPTDVLDYPITQEHARHDPHRQLPPLDDEPTERIVSDDD